MKIFLFSILLCQNASATHWLTYFVYVETQYTQGTWSRTNLLEQSDYTYLSPQIQEDLFGSLKEDLVNKMLFRLKENNPEAYNWNYVLSFQGDTVILATENRINAFETVKNEITATLTLNNFKAVTFTTENYNQTFEIGDVSLPFFDLISTNSKAVVPLNISTPIKPTAILDSTPIVPVKDKSKTIPIWLILSVILNILLAGILIKNKG